MPTTKAIVHIDPMAADQQAQIDGLKRIALLFDEIHFKVATGWQIRDEVARDPRRYGPGPNDNLLPARGFKPFENGYNPLDDVTPSFALHIESWPAELRETLDALQEAGIAKPVDEEEIKIVDPLERLGLLRSTFVEMDYKDDEFFTLSGGRPNLDFTFGRLGFEPLPGSTGSDSLDYIQFPPAFLDSIALTETLYLSHYLGGNSVFLRPRYGRELEYRFRKFRTGIKALNEIAPEIAATLRVNARFGELVFTVANSVISSSLLSTRSLEELLRFRVETSDSRQRFISSGLNELDEQVSENTWSPAAREEMNHYIATKLKSDILAYDDATTQLWESMFGKIIAKMSWVTPAAIAGGNAAQQMGGMVGNVMPNATPLTLMLIGLLPLLPKRPASLITEVVDAIVKSRQERRSSIAYVSRLSKLG